MLKVNWNPDARQLRIFGLIACSACVGLGVSLYLSRGTAGAHFEGGVATRLAGALWILSVALGLFACFDAARLRPLYVLLTAITLPIGLVVSFGVMVFLFFGVFTPLGLLLRATGHDALRLRFDRDARSYWISRPSTVKSGRYFRQF
jgi:hypothetical protein